MKLPEFFLLFFLSEAVHMFGKNCRGNWMGQGYGLSKIVPSFPASSLIWKSLAVGDLNEDNIKKEEEGRRQQQNHFSCVTDLESKTERFAQGHHVSQSKLLTLDASESHALYTWSAVLCNKWMGFNFEFKWLPITGLIGILGFWWGFFLFFFFWVALFLADKDWFPIWALGMGHYLHMNTHTWPSPLFYKKSQETVICLSSPTHSHTYVHLRNVVGCETRCSSWMLYVNIPHVKMKAIWRKCHQPSHTAK